MHYVLNKRGKYRRSTSREYVKKTGPIICTSMHHEDYHKHIFIYRLSQCIIHTPLSQLKSDIYYPVYNPHPYFTATGDRIGAVCAWLNTNVSSHKLTFKPGYHIYTFFLCHIFVCRYLQ